MTVKQTANNEIGKGKAGPGRPKGVPNKTTVVLKEAILEALNGVGGVSYLMRQAEENPASFMSMLGKVLPLQIAGDKDNPLTINGEIVLRGVSSDRRND